MTLHNIIELGGTFLFAYGLTLCLFGGTVILTDMFIDWYVRFKKSRQDKAAKDGKDGQ